MNSHAPIFIAPPITEIPDYVWSRQYDKPCFLPGKPVRKPKEEGRRISHPDAESALRAAKRASRANSARWLGRSSSQADATEFLVYEDGKVIERHTLSTPSTASTPATPLTPCGRGQYLLFQTSLIYVSKRVKPTLR